jgi:DNA mismatch repair protein MutH
MQFPEERILTAEPTVNDIVTDLEANSPLYQECLKQNWPGLQNTMVLMELERRVAKQQEAVNMTHQETVNALDEIVGRLGPQPVYHLLDALRSLCDRRADFYHGEGHLKLRNQWEVLTEIISSTCGKILKTELR